MDGDQIGFMRLLQDFLAVAAPSGGALRNQEPGVLKVVQDQLAKICLSQVPSDSANSYRRWLDRHTEEMLDAMTVDVRPWGAARKALNLFMRACICDHYLRLEYRLGGIEPLAEIPLDSIVATALKKEAGRGQLPVWPGLKRLKREQNEHFQAFAEEYSRRLALPARVYLDNYLWLANR